MDIDETIAYIQSTLNSGATWVPSMHVATLLVEIERLRAQLAAPQDEEHDAPRTPRHTTRKAKQDAG